MKFPHLQHESSRLMRTMLGISLCVLSFIGCGEEKTPPVNAPKSTPPPPQNVSIDEEAVGEFTLNQKQFQEQFPVTDQEPVPVEKIFRPTHPEPSHSQETLAKFGYRRYESKHLVLFTDIEPETAQRLVTLTDQEYDAWIEYFGPLPAARDGSDFRMTGYLMRDMGALVELGLVPREYLSMRTGGHKQTQFWMLDQETDYYRRHLLFHEATHCFMTIMPDTILPKWYLEGMAELLGTHRITPNDGIEFRVLPEDKEQYAGWGRIKTIQEEVSAGRFKTIAKIREIQRIDPINEVRDYAWSWAFCYFLDAHPHYQQRFRSLRDHWRSGAFLTEFDRLFADDLSQLNTEWMLFVTSIMEGFDLPRAAIEFAPNGSQSMVKISAEKGWQSTGWQITQGETYHLTAKGEVTLATDPKPWVSQPNGITLEYFEGKPIGRLMGIVVNLSVDQTPEIINLGQDFSWTANASGTLFLRINDAWNSLANNSGSYQVEFE
jgi:hypothetical protein